MYLRKSQTRKEREIESDMQEGWPVVRRARDTIESEEGFICNKWGFEDSLHLIFMNE